MPKDFMVSRDGQQYGPYSTEDLQQYLNEGKIDLDDFVWSEGMDEWRPLREVRDQLASPSIKPSDIQGKIHEGLVIPAVAQKSGKTANANWKKIGILFLFCVVIAIGWSVFSGKKDNASIVGAWSCTDPRGNSDSAGVQTFLSNGAVEFDFISIKEPNGNIEPLRMLGRYEVDGDSIKMVCDSSYMPSLGTHRCTLSYSGKITKLDKDNLSYEMTSNRNNLSSYQCTRSK